MSFDSGASAAPERSGKGGSKGQPKPTTPPVWRKKDVARCAELPVMPATANLVEAMATLAPMAP